MVNSERSRLDLTFLGSGNAFGSEGRAFSSFLLNGRYLFDCGPTVLQQLARGRIDSSGIEVVVISHFHGDHFLGLPFLFLEAHRRGRTHDLVIVGPPGIEERTEHLEELAFPHSGHWGSDFRRVYMEVEDGRDVEAAGLSLHAARVDHVSSLECFAYRATLGDRTLVYSGDSRICDPLLELVEDAEVLVLECACDGNEVHLSPADVAAVVSRAPADAQTVVTHLDGLEHPEGFRGLHVASDLARFSF